MGFLLCWCLMWPGCGLVSAQDPRGAGEVRPNDLPRLTDVRAIRRLSAAELRRGYPVQLEGRVIQSWPNLNQIILQIGDSGTSIYVTERRGVTTVGQKVRVQGFTVAQRPVQVLANKLTVVDDTVRLPEPKKLSVIDAVIDPPKFCRVEITGVVVSAISRPLCHDLLVRDHGSTFPVQIHRKARVPSPSDVLDARMTFTGVITDISSDRGGNDAGLIVPGWDATTIVKPAPTQPFSRQRKQVSTIQKSKPGSAPEFRVRLRGEVIGDPNEGLLRLRDESGEMVVRLTGRPALAAGEVLDVMGFVEHNDRGVFLDRAHFRRLGLPRTRLAVDHSALPGTKLDDYARVHRQIKSIRRLGKKQLQALPPAVLTGNIVNRDGKTGMIYVQDAGGGIGVLTKQDEVPPIGARVEVRGFVAPTATSPVVKWATIKPLKGDQNARALKGSSGALALGRLDSQWISLEGVGRGVDSVGDETHLRFARTDRKFSVRIAGIEAEALEHLVDAKLLLRGVARTLLDADGQNIGSELLVAKQEDIEILEPAPTNAFTIPLQSIDGLKRFRTEGTYTHRNRTIGTVTLAWPNLVHIDDGTNVLRLRVTRPSGLLVGQRADVVGFPHLGRFGLEFEDAVLKNLGPADAIAPRKLSIGDVLNQGRDGELVRIDGTLIKQVSAATEHVLMLQTEAETFPAVLPTMYVTPGMRELQEGSRVRIRGILQLDAEPNKPPHSFRVLLPDADSVSVLQHPSWWTTPRLTAAIGVLAGLIALMLFWADGLRRRSLRSETRFVQAVNSSPIAVAIVAADDQRLLEVNDRFLRLTGRDRGSVLERTLAGLRIWPDMPKTADLTAGSLEAVWRGADGEPAQVLVSAEAIEMAGTDALLLSAVDVTEKFRLLERLRDSQKMEAVGKLAAGVAHDFNNLLTVIRGNSEMLKEDIDRGTDLAELNDEVTSAAQRAAELTAQLLAFSRRQLLCMRAVDVGELMDGALRMLRRILEENIKIVTELPDSCPTINADAGTLEQVLINLAVNARDAMPGGGVLTIKVDAVEIDVTEARLHPDVVAGPFARIRISDTGSGMDRITRERVFDPFFTTKQQGRGTGLGLATVYGIVRQHRGWVDVESEPGVGSSFIIYLPEYLDEDEESDDNNRSFPVGTESILVVEDERQVRRIAVGILKRAGYRVTEAENAAEARGHWREADRHFDLVLTDILMPGGESGIELAQDLRAQRPDLKIITMTGYSGDAISHSEIDEVGAILIHKPFTRASLTALVRDVLDGTAPTAED